MTPLYRHILRLAQRRGTFSSDAQLRWLFLSILCVGLMFTLHASGRQKAGPTALADMQPRVLTIASVTPLAAPVIETAARSDNAATSRRGASGVQTDRRAPRTMKRLRAYTEEQVQNLIRTYAEAFGLDAEIPLAIARCESQFQWDAANRGSSARGVFQYVARTWRHTDEGKRGTSALDADANIRMALTHMLTIGTSPWKASRSCWSAGRSNASIVKVASAEPSTEPVAEATSGSESDAATDADTIDE
jgi:hypothetical protein